MRFIPTKIHGVLDYVIGILLIAAPWIFGFTGDPWAMGIPIALGVGVLLYSSVTDYELGAVHAISMPAHLALDIGGGLLLAASPWLFQFVDQVWLPHVVVGLLEMGSGVMTKTSPSYGPSPRARHYRGVS